MTDAIATTPTEGIGIATHDKTASRKSNTVADERVPLKIDSSQWWRALLFILSMSLMGLNFPLGYLFVPLCLISSWRNDRYDFIIQLTFFVGAYALLGEKVIFIKGDDIALFLGLIGVFIYRKPPLVCKVLIALGLYALLMLVLARFSEESISIQIRTWRYWFLFIYFLVPLMVFAGKKFEIRELMHHIFPYVLIVCGFYIIDAFVINGHVLIPNSFIWGDVKSTWNSPALYGFGAFPRKYPPGLFWLTMIIVPVNYYYKLKWWHWLLIFGSLIAARTFTLIVTVIFGLMVFQPKKTRVVGFSIAAFVLLSVAYAVDTTLPTNPENDESMLRVKSSVDQIINLGEAEDDEDLSEAGSGRIGQALPKFELMYHYGKEWTGLGFLHPQLTTNTKYIIKNEYYHDQEKSIEVATGIEVAPLQVLLTVGYIGLAIHLAFFIYLWIAVRGLRYALYFRSILVMVFILGIGGFSGWIGGQGLYLMALSFSAVLMANRDRVWGGRSQKNVYVNRKMTRDE